MPKPSEPRGLGAPRTTHVWVHKHELGERLLDVADLIDRGKACGVDPGETFAELRRHRVACCRAVTSLRRPNGVKDAIDYTDDGLLPNGGI